MPSFFVLYLRFALIGLRQYRNSHLVVGCLHFTLFRSGTSSGFALLVDSDNWLHFFACKKIKPIKICNKLRFFRFSFFFATQWQAIRFWKVLSLFVQDYQECLHIVSDWVKAVERTPRFNDIKNSMLFLHNMEVSITKIILFFVKLKFHYFKTANFIAIISFFQAVAFGKLRFFSGRGKMPAMACCFLWAAH